MNSASDRLRVLLLASDCNPEWPSLPVVGYKYARALAERCDVTLVTHIRNRPNLEKPEAAVPGMRIVYIDTEYVARPLYRLATFLRGGSEVAWSTNMILAYPPYVEFERRVWKRFRRALKAGEFDLVHRITPMSPTLPSYIAGRAPQPFVLGPLNGNLAWPEFFRAEQAREKEGLRRLRGLYKFLPYVRSTYRRAACVLAAFQHTIDDLDHADPARVTMFPEVGYDEEIFHPRGRRAGPAAAPVGEGGAGEDGAGGDAPAPPAAGGEDGRMRFLFVGRLVPYKLPEVLVRAFAASPLLRRQSLEVIGSGPELPRLQALVAEHGLEDCVHFGGRLSQAEVADRMRASDVFAFPSIRELGAGVVVEAMACGMLCVVADYGAPGDLVAPERGLKAPLGPLEEMVESFRLAMERCVEMPAERREAMREAAERYASEQLRWGVKAEKTERLYSHLLSETPGPAPVFYGPEAERPRA